MRALPNSIETLLLDIRFALRTLRKLPALVAVATLTLMLGIGANVAVFGVLNAVLLKPLAVRDPQSLYQLRHQRWMSGRLLTTSYPAFEDFRRRNTTFSALAAVFGYSEAVLAGRNTLKSVHGDEVSGDYFDLLGAQPQAGRFFHAADEHGPGSAPYIVLSDELWRTVFNADRRLVGETVRLDQHPFTVLGVAGARFHGAERFVWPDYWIPMLNEQQVEGSDYLRNRKLTAVTVLGRLKPGVTPQQATGNLNSLAAELAREYPETDDGQPLRLIHPGLLGDDGDVIRGFLYGVTVLALLVLLAVSANLATLYAAQVADRSRELAVRMALGSSRGRLMKQLLTEAVALSLLGGAAGLASAKLVLGVLNRSDPFAGAVTLPVDARVFLAGVVLTLGSALLFSLLPAWQACRRSPSQMLKNGPVADALRLGRFGSRELLLGMQIAVCTLLVTASLVAVRGMLHALQTPLGIQPRGAMLADLDLSRAGIDGDAAKIEAILEAMRNIPGVTAAGTIDRTPFTGGLHGVPIFAAGTTDFKLNNSLLAAYVYQASPGYLQAAGTRLLSGRDVSWHDTLNTPRVAIVNETIARKLWGEGGEGEAGNAALGRRFLVNGNLTEVVGVAETGKYHDLEEAPQPAVYLPLSQSGGGETVFVIRSQRPPSEMAAALENSLRRVAPNVPAAVQSWSGSLASELFPARAATAALGCMGLLAAMLALTGIFGMATYTVSRRRKELGIRVALGAGRRQVMSAAVGRPMVLLAAGSGVGLLAGIFTSRFLGQIVYRANPRDPFVMAGAVLTMALLGAAASALPANRALAVDPSQLMREE